GAVVGLSVRLPVSIANGSSSSRRRLGVTVCALVPVLVTSTWKVCRLPARAVDSKLPRLSTRLEPSAAGAPVLVGSDSAAPPCRRGADRAGAWALGGDAKIDRRAANDALDQGRRRRNTAVGLAVRLDDERRLTGDERRGLAGAAEDLDVRRPAGVVEAVAVDLHVRAAERPAEVARREHIERLGAQLASAGRA